MARPLLSRGRILAVLLLLCLSPRSAAALAFRMENRTQGPLAAQPVFATVTARDGEGRFQRMDASGAFHPCRPEDNRVPHQGLRWCAYSFPAGDFDIDATRPLFAGRLYLSVGSPLYLRVDPATGGLVQPDPGNPSDPNLAIPFDWLEFTVDASGFHGNTTCVDMFGLPIRLEVLDRDGRASGPVGLEASRSELLRAWGAEVPEPFRGLVRPEGRILAPGHAPAGDPVATALDAHIAACWSRFRTEPPAFRIGADTFTGRVEADGSLAFTRPGDADVHRIEGRPTSLEAFRCDGVLDRGDAVARALGARVGAYLNRNPGRSGDPATWYQPPCNAYAAFWHRHGLGGLAYGFPYDDVDGQSTLLDVREPVEVRVAFRVD